MKYRMLVLMLLSGFLAACGTTRHVSVVKNPYDESARSFAEVGVAMMHLERWDAARHSFERELVAAQMADDTESIVLAHYNLGSVLLAAGDRSRGRQQMHQCLVLARRYGVPIMSARASLALALDQARTGAVPDTPVMADIQSSWPADVQLSAGRMALYRHHPSIAQQAYMRALHKAGKNRSGVILQAQAHLGLAMVARALNDHAALVSELQRALMLCRRAGAPRVAAESLLMLGLSGGSIIDRQDALERSLSIYRALRDNDGQRRVLDQLIALSTGKDQLHWKHRLKKLGPALTGSKSRNSN